MDAPAFPARWKVCAPELIAETFSSRCQGTQAFRRRRRRVARRALSRLAARRRRCAPAHHDGLLTGLGSSSEFVMVSAIRVPHRRPGIPRSTPRAMQPRRPRSKGRSRTWKTRPRRSGAAGYCRSPSQARCAQGRRQGSQSRSQPVRTIRRGLASGGIRRREDDIVKRILDVTGRSARDQFLSAISSGKG